jgi:hypothetical protein
MEPNVCKRCSSSYVSGPNELCTECIKMDSLIGSQVGRARNVYERYLLEKAVKESERRYHLTLLDLEATSETM